MTAQTIDCMSSSFASHISGLIGQLRISDSRGCDKSSNFQYFCMLKFHYVGMESISQLVIKSLFVLMNMSIRRNTEIVPLDPPTFNVENLYVKIRIQCIKNSLANIVDCDPVHTFTKSSNISTRLTSVSVTLYIVGNEDCEASNPIAMSHGSRAKVLKRNSNQIIHSTALAMN